MKKWVPVTDNTLYLPGFVNIGYHRGVLIDSGISINEAREVTKSLKDQQLPVRWLLNTHTHPDHCGGNMGMIAEGATLCAIEQQIPFLENLNLSAFFSYGAEFVYTDQRQFQFTDARPSHPTKIIQPGNVILDDMEFIIQMHIGHAMDQVTIKTPDEVLFSADITISEQMLSHSKLELLYSATEEIEDLNWLMSAEYSVCVPGHGAPVQDIGALAKMNLERHYEYIDEAYRFCAEPHTREEISAHLIRKYSLKSDCSFCATVNSTVGAYLMNLVRDKKLWYFSRNGYTMYGHIGAC